MKYKRKEILFYYENILFTILFIVGEMKCNFISQVVQVDLLKTVNKPERDIETSMLEATMQAFIEEVSS